MTDNDKPSAAGSAPAEEPKCKTCQGHGMIPTLANSGPDPMIGSNPINCPECYPACSTCKGTGMIATDPSAPIYGGIMAASPISCPDCYRGGYEWIKKSEPLKARLDADGTAKPLTEIVGHVKNEAIEGQWCMGDNPHYIKEYTIRETGKKV